ncbi:MAG: FliA/WhiG family RNA polymerase sigma factor [Eubacteriales bacterium]|nr:FliA/WhiG family RNA polymerase sigma factor [Eubacteriales bacterium]
MLAEQEITYDMWVEFKENPCIEMRNHILLSYLGLVKNIAWRLVPTYKNHLEFDDLYSLGVLGLMDAIEKYDVEKNIKFETYASLRIKGAIIDQIRKQDWIPRNLRQKIKMVEDAYSTLENRDGKAPSDKEMAQYLGISTLEVKKIITESYTYQVISMDEQLMDIMNKDELISKETSPEQDYENKELKKELAEIIDRLTPNEKMVISLYYFDELNQKEISNVMNLSESRVSQLHSRALIKIKSHISKRKLFNV